MYPSINLVRDHLPLLGWEFDLLGADLYVLPQLILSIMPQGKSVSTVVITKEEIESIPAVILKFCLQNFHSPNSCDSGATNSRDITVPKPRATVQPISQHQP